MAKPHKLNKGDKVAIVSLSRGLLGMPFCKHELDIAIKRLEEFGLIPVIMPNALKDMDYLEKHPEARASDLKQAFMDDSIKGIICAIGGDDTYKTIPYLMEDEEFINAVKNHPKIFTGFSDTTNNHLMLNKLGLSTFYGPCLLVDLAELDNEMLPYTKQYFEKFFMNESNFEIESSPIWYFDRESYGTEEVGKPRKSQNEQHGFEVLNGKGIITGKLYGGCLDSLYDIYTSERYGNENEVFTKYNILPTLDEWKEKILFIETSEEKMPPDKLEIILSFFKNNKVLESVKGVIVGKPIDEKYYDEYKQVYKKVFADLETPVLYNVNFGHSVPRCIIPYDAEATIDFDNRRITINTPLFEEKTIDLIVKCNESLFGTDPIIEKINVGFTNTLYRVNDLYIVKVCTDLSNEEKFKREIDFYNSNKENTLIPKLYYSDTTKEDVPYFYEILEKVNGVSLYNVWHTYSEEQREDIIRQLCDAMKQMHSIKGDRYNWAEHMKKEFNPLYEKAKELNIFSDEEQKLLEQAYSDFDKYLESDEFVLVHNDLHFDNIFIDNGRIKIIDFERSMYAPRDFELDIFYRMVRKPWKFASEETEEYTEESQYSNIMSYVNKYYPEIVSTPSLYERLGIYDIVYFLAQLVRHPELDELKNDVLSAAKIVTSKDEKINKKF